MSEKVCNVLFLCTHNSARSVVGECTLNALGQGRFRGFSAGSHPKGVVNPFAIEMLAGKGYDTSRLASKSWDVFAEPGAPAMDVVVTVCDDAAGEACPHWPGAPVTVHWGLPDPSAVQGDAEKRAAFEDTHRILFGRLERFVALPIASLDRLTLRERLEELARG